MKRGRRGLGRARTKLWDRMTGWVRMPARVLAKQGDWPPRGAKTSGGGCERERVAASVARDE